MKLELLKEDVFDKWRAEVGADKVDDILATFGMGPKYKPVPPTKYICKKCGKPEATIKEIHADTDMNEMVRDCKACGYQESV